MTFWRLFLFLILAVNVASAVENSATISGYSSDSDSTPLAKPAPIRPSPWFSGMKGVPADLKFSALPAVYSFEGREHRVIAPRDNVCLMMRTYMVKRSERFSDTESGRRGYTTCQMARNFQMRSTDEVLLPAPQR